MDVIFEDIAVGGLKRYEVLVPGLDGLEFVLRVLGLSLMREGDSRNREENRLTRKEVKETG